MAFESGSLSFRICHLPQELPENSLSLFAENVAGPLEYVREEPQWGWVSGRHLLETRIDEETAIMGGYKHICLRQAERKVPNALLQAECRMVELSRLAERDADYLGRKEKREIKQEVMERLLPDMPPQLSGFPCVLDENNSLLYAAATSDKQLDQFLEMFNQTIGFEPLVLAPETAVAFCADKEAEQIPRVNFSPVLDDTHASGTVGQDFLTWLWFFQEQNEGQLPKTQLGEFSFMIDGPLVFVSDGEGAQESTLKKGLPTLSAEAKAALTVGKKLRQAKLIIARTKDETWEVNIDADNFVFKGMKLPDGEALDPGSMFEERITFLFMFQKLFFELFRMFLEKVSDPQELNQMQDKAKAWVEGIEAR